ncbi:MAG TPA: hypothetical protein VHL11_00940 [Phototrophicaceae bacterium]|nr:hypothetical protein [Phototrophicaceae bacterium]
MTKKVLLSLSVSSVLILILSFSLVSLQNSLQSQSATQSQSNLLLHQTDPLTVDLLYNGGFEVDLDADKLPDDWSGSNTDVKKSDKLKCDPSLAHTGDCAFMFRGNPDGTSSKLTQSVPDLSQLIDGANLHFSAFIDPRSGTPGTTFGKVKVALSDGGKLGLDLLIPASNAVLTRAAADYAEVTDDLTLNLNGATATKVKVLFTTSQVKGKFLIDDASLIVTNDILPTPTRTPQATLTPSSTLTEPPPSPTKTPVTPSPTGTLPTDTPTLTLSTPSPVSPPSGTPTATTTPTQTATSTTDPGSPIPLGPPTDTPTMTPTPTNTQVS